MYLQRSSALSGLSDAPPFVVYHELRLTAREYMSVVTAVDPEVSYFMIILWHTLLDKTILLTAFI
jgi:hypothetical protein